ncbi:hypothetical protein Q91_1461 [Cycloclasticus sp. P1]|nr:hypothetical protein Q91_1461 [Cycloclasticus sp. P1]
MPKGGVIGEFYGKLGLLFGFAVKVLVGTLKFRKLSPFN